MYHVSAQGIDERMINVHYYYYLSIQAFSCYSSRMINTPVQSYPLSAYMFTKVIVSLD